MFLRISICILFLLTIGCVESNHFAPVLEVSTIEPLPKNGIYTVARDDTLYSIAWAYGLDYRYLAEINHIARPYHIEAGSKILLRKKINKIKVKKQYADRDFDHIPLLPPRDLTPISSKSELRHEQTSRKVVIKRSLVEKEPLGMVHNWLKPAYGSVFETFGEFNKGINISGTRGDPIFTTAAGKVVYSGNGLRAYGNLIIIKHNSEFLSAYAHNSKIMVKEGDWVKAGQKIAEMGNTGARRVMLHFEIRRNGKPVNPLSYLARR